MILLPDYCDILLHYIAFLSGTMFDIYLQFGNYCGSCCHDIITVDFLPIAFWKLPSLSRQAREAATAVRCGDQPRTLLAQKTTAT